MRPKWDVATMSHAGWGGPLGGRRHDSTMLADSAILPLIQQYSINQNGNQLCIYGDLVYTLWPPLQIPFSNPQLNPMVSKP